MDFLLQPGIYKTTNNDSTLLSLLEKAWIKDLKPHVKTYGKFLAFCEKKGIKF